MDKELEEARQEAMVRHLDRVGKRCALKTTHKTEEMLDYIDFYIGLLDAKTDNYIKYLETRKIKYLNRMKEAQEILSETAEEALFDVGS